MRSVRILTGRHAGAEVVLSLQQQRISSDDEADIQIADWQHRAVDLFTEEDGIITWALSAANGASTAIAPRPARKSLQDFVPQRFGDVVLCVGPSDGSWPSDLALLSALINPPASTQGGPRVALRRVWTVASTIAAAVTGAAALSLVYSAPGESAKPHPPRMMQIQQALAAAEAGKLRLVPDGNKVVVEGMLEHVSEVARVRSALQPFDGFILHRYGAASDVARAIAEAAGGAQVHVQHQGGGVFLVRGSTKDLQSLLGTLRRVVADLSEGVERIDVQVAEIAAKTNAVANAVYLDGNVQYSEARDGTRHLAVLGHESLPAGRLTSNHVVSITRASAPTATGSGRD